MLQYSTHEVIVLDCLIFIFNILVKTVSILKLNNLKSINKYFERIKKQVVIFMNHIKYTNFTYTKCV